MKEIKELNDSDLNNVIGGMNEKEFINYLKNSCQDIPDNIRESIIDKYIECGKPPTIKLINSYIKNYGYDYLESLLDII